MLHRVLSKLVQEQLLEKIGRPPKVYYRIKESAVSSISNNVVTKEEADFLAAHFNLFTETGNELNGLEAFEKWCVRQKLPLEKTVAEYIKTREKYLSYFGNNELIDGTEKLKNTKGFSKVCVDEMYYGDFYAIERFGKTAIGNLIHFAKQGQNKMLMEKICLLLKGKIEILIEREGIDVIGYIPPTIKREV
jgi:hypothetical protein